MSDADSPRGVSSRKTSRRTAAPQAGRTPSQARSRKRVERILKAAEKLVERTGFAHVTMSDVARVARMPLASVYQYFANRTALMSALGERQFKKQQSVLAEALGSAELSADPERALDTIIEVSATSLRDNPLYDQVWSGMQADRELRLVDVEDMRQVAELLLPALEALLPRAPARRLRAVAVLLQLTVFANVRYSLAECSSVDFGQMVDELKFIVRQYVRALIAEYGAA